MERETGQRVRAWWRETPLWILLFFAACVHLGRVDSLSLRGEETRRGFVAKEMQRTGDWIVPRLQGVLYLSRPPLQNWAIGGFASLTGGVNKLAIRLPSVLATILTVFLVYVYGRQFLSPLGAFAAGMVYCTMAQVLILGHLGETEAMFTLLVSGSLLLWHLGYTRGWTPTVVWSVGYALAACGLLCKGTQAPLYFVCCIGVYLLVVKNLRYAWTWQHALGIGVFLLIWGSWQFSYAFSEGWEASWNIYARNVSARFGHETAWSEVLIHLGEYPLEVLICMLPWSPFAWLYFRQDFRDSLEESRSMVVFLFVCLAVAFPSVWFPPESRSRYFMPLYPCTALLLGTVIEKGILATSERVWGKAWKQFSTSMGIVMLVVSLGVIVVSFAGNSVVAQPLLFAGCYFVICIVSWFLLQRNIDLHRSWQPYASILAVGLFCALTVNGVMLNVKQSRSNDVRGNIADSMSQLPDGVELTSLKLVDHRVAFRLDQPVQRAEWPVADTPDFEYFCFTKASFPAELGFAWEQITEIDVDRDRTEKRDPMNLIVIGRVLRDAELVTAEPSGTVRR